MFISAAGRQESSGSGGHDSGLVRDRVLRLELPHPIWNRCRFINQNFRGWEMEAVRREIAPHPAGAQRIRPADAIGGAALSQGALATEDASKVVFVEGASNLVTGEQDRQRLRELLATLEEKQRIVELLGAYLDTKQEAVRVVMGLDEAMPSYGISC